MTTKAVAICLNEQDSKSLSKVCKDCGERKPFSEFQKEKRMTDGHRNQCTPCLNAYRRALYARDSVRITARIRNYRMTNPQKACHDWRRWHHGISVASYNEMVAAQNGACAICLTPERSLNKQGLVRMLSIDHDHGTGMIRGLLCNACNRAIGLLKDDIQVLEGAVSYLKKHAPASPSENIIEFGGAGK